MFNLSLLASYSLNLSSMSDLHDIKVGDWLMIVSTIKGSTFLLQQVTSVTSGLVRTQNHTFRRDGRAFSTRYKSLTARPATASEIEAWLARNKRDGTQKPVSTEPSEDVLLARYLTSVSESDWLKLGLPQLRNIKTAFKNQRGK